MTSEQLTPLAPRVRPPAYDVPTLAERTARKHRKDVLFRRAAVAMVGASCVLGIAVGAVLIWGPTPASKTAPSGETIGFGGQRGHAGTYEVNMTGSPRLPGQADGGRVYSWEPDTFWKMVGK